MARLAQRLQVGPLVAPTLRATLNMINFGGLRGDALFLAAHTQWIRSEVHQAQSLPSPAVSTSRRRAAPLVGDLRALDLMRLAIAAASHQLGAAW